MWRLKHPTPPALLSSLTDHGLTPTRRLADDGTVPVLMTLTEGDKMIHQVS